MVRLPGEEHVPEASGEAAHLHRPRLQRERRRARVRRGRLQVQARVRRRQERRCEEGEIITNHAFCFYNHAFYFYAFFSEK